MIHQTPLTILSPDSGGPPLKQVAHQMKIEATTTPKMGHKKILDQPVSRKQMIDHI